MIPLPNQNGPTGWNTTCEQVGSASDWDFILCLMESVYQGLTSVGQSRLWPDTVKHVVAEIKEDLKEHISLHRVSQAPPETRAKYVPLPNLWLDPHRGLKALLHRVLVNSRAEVDPRTKGRGFKARDTGPQPRDPSPRVLGPVPRIGDHGIMMNDPQAMAKLAQRMRTQWIKVGKGVRGLRDVAGAYRSNGWCTKPVSLPG